MLSVSKNIPATLANFAFSGPLEYDIAIKTCHGLAIMVRAGMSISQSIWIFALVAFLGSVTLVLRRAAGRLRTRDVVFQLAILFAVVLSLFGIWHLQSDTQDPGASPEKSQENGQI